MPIGRTYTGKKLLRIVIKLMIMVRKQTRRRERETNLIESFRKRAPFQQRESGKESPLESAAI